MQNRRKFEGIIFLNLIIMEVIRTRIAIFVICLDAIFILGINGDECGVKTE